MPRGSEDTPFLTFGSLAERSEEEHRIQDGLESRKRSAAQKKTSPEAAKDVKKSGQEHPEAGQEPQI